MKPLLGGASLARQAVYQPDSIIHRPDAEPLTGHSIGEKVNFVVHVNKIQSLTTLLKSQDQTRPAQTSFTAHQARSCGTMCSSFSLSTARGRLGSNRTQLAWYWSIRWCTKRASYALASYLLCIYCTAQTPESLLYCFQVDDADGPNGNSIGLISRRRQQRASPEHYLLPMFPRSGWHQSSSLVSTAL